MTSNKPSYTDLFSNHEQVRISLLHATKRFPNFEIVASIINAEQGTITVALAYEDNSPAFLTIPLTSIAFIERDSDDIIESLGLTKVEQDDDEGVMKYESR